MDNSTLISGIIGFVNLITIENEFSLKLVELTKWINQERYFHTMIYVRHESEEDSDGHNTNEIFRKLMEQNHVVIMNLKGNTSYYLWNNFNRQCMAMVELRGDEQEDRKLLKTLWKTLRRNVLSRLLLLISEYTDDDYISNLLKFCRENKAFNVMLVKENLKESNEIYRPQIYPRLEMKLLRLNESNTEVTQFYPDHVQNMQKYPLRLVMNQISSKCYVLRRENGQIFLGGYVGHFFMELGRKLNATLTFPSSNESDDQPVTFSLDKLVEQGLYDASTEPTYNLYTSDMVYSHIYDYMDWCIMVPVEKPVHASTYYVIIYDYVILSLILTAFLLFSIVLALALIVKRQRLVVQQLIINIYILNGLLGQSYKMEPTFVGVRSFIYMLVCVAGLIFNTTYVTYLQTFNASPPTDKVIQSMADIQASGMKIAVYKPEFMLLDAYGVAGEFKAFMELITSYSDYTNLRSGYDTRYAYPVPSAQWSLYEQQQKFYAKPRFRLSKVCLIEMIGLMIPLQDNSPFEEAVNNLIAQVNQGGIVTHWKSAAFLESLQLKTINLNDTSTITMFEPMKIEDLQLLMEYFVMAIVGICCSFVMEVYWPHRGIYGRKFLHKIKLLYERFMG